MVTFDSTLPDRITAEARQISFAHIFAVVLGAVFYAIGWSAAKVLGALWFALAWSAAAIKLGWQEARASSQASPR